MTQIELETLTFVKNAAKKYVSEKKIDWEQRRYEIAKAVLPRVDEQVCGVLEKGGSLLYESLAKQCAVIACQLADALIEELKK